MFKFLQIVFFVFLIKQFDCFTLKNSSFHDEAYDLLLKIKWETSEATLEYTNNMDTWIDEIYSNQDTFNFKIEAILDKKQAETELKINETEKEAESKGPNAELCITISRKSLESLRDVADSYFDCTDSTNTVILRKIGKVQQDISHLSDQIYDVDAKFLECGNDESCFEKLIPFLEKILVNLPAQIRSRTQDVDEDVKASINGNLEANCDPTKEFATNCDRIISDILECVSQV